jgi:hypothetical protein
MNPFTKTSLRLGKLQSLARPAAQPQPTTAEEEAILFGVAEPGPDLLEKGGRSIATEADQSLNQG